MPLNLTFESYYPGGALWDEFISMLVRLGFGAQMYRQITSNPLKGAVWDTIAKTYVKGEDIRIPMLIVGSWYDVYPDTVPQAFETIRTGGGENARLHSKLVIGPWTHAIEDVKIGSRMWLRNTSSKEEFLEPGTTYPVTVALNHTALTFPAGHRIRLIVSSSDNPRHAVNFNDGGPMYEKKTGLVALNKIYCDKQHASALVLPAALFTAHQAAW